ncbi:MAG TPA: hypothetical protein VME63_11995 [Dyella sp.]|uniref:hypothetical protein n=1 Tax=Dyella sp. TaxID=1869338 RepID=UPI002B88D4CA|nr:hypothetical protein [Dyella sp.]HTV86125.1 hypothetical protein [Dyella sp.]
MATKLNRRTTLSPSVMQHSQFVNLWLKQTPGPHEIRMQQQRRHGVLYDAVHAYTLPATKAHRH